MEERIGCGLIALGSQEICVCLIAPPGFLWLHTYRRLFRRRPRSHPALTARRSHWLSLNGSRSRPRPLRNTRETRTCVKPPNLKSLLTLCGENTLFFPPWSTYQMTGPFARDPCLARFPTSEEKLPPENRPAELCKARLETTRAPRRCIQGPVIEEATLRQLERSSLLDLKPWWRVNARAAKRWTQGTLRCGDERTETIEAFIFFLCSLRTGIFGNR